MLNDSASIRTMVATLDFDWIVLGIGIVLDDRFPVWENGLPIFFGGVNFLLRRWRVANNQDSDASVWEMIFFGGANSLRHRGVHRDFRI